ncbi:MAG TPA: hypothetical protein VF815_21675 [Myxococcaceae bacterium]|jgi:hypothetical protein
MPLRLFSIGLGVLLAACSTTPKAAPPSAEEFSHRVLVIRESSDGEVSHSWQRAEDFDSARATRFASGESATGYIVLASGQQDDCYEQYLECYYQCRKAPVPPEFDQYLYDLGPIAGHERYCSEKCMRQYTDCLKATGRRHKEFTAMDDALDWLKRHHKAVLAGSLIVIAGVVFVVVSAGAGIVVLAPVVLVTAGPPPLAPPLATVSP